MEGVAPAADEADGSESTSSMGAARTVLQWGRLSRYGRILNGSTVGHQAKVSVEHKP